MVIAVALISSFLILSTGSRAVVAGRLQSLAEMSYEFIAKMLRESAGTEGMKFFPFVFSLFMFVLVLNLLGLMPYFFTVTPHRQSRRACGDGDPDGHRLRFFRNGLSFMKLFVPQACPATCCRW